ncbi:MAG: hypothetical protein JW845_05860 [Dehalococcoidales bacterium]|nr:hypothetical protein [Dehalococcoidales bacterium]
MEKRRSVAKIVGGTIVIVFFIYFLLLIGSMVPIAFWLVSLLIGLIILLLNVANWKGVSWNLGPKSLVIINFSISVYLLALYFFIFGLVSGLHWVAVTWGLPILIGIVFLIMDTIYLIRKEDIKRGMRGFSFGLGAYSYTAVMLIFFSHLLMTIPQNTPSETVNQEGNKILELVLNDLYGNDSSYVMISPQTTLGNGEYDNDYLEKMKGEIIGSFTISMHGSVYYIGDSHTSVSISKTAFQELINRFIKENRSPHTLSIPSSLEKGYYIDYDKRYSWYPFPVWHLTHPVNGPIVDVSSPVYDERSGLVIIYIGTYYDNTIYFFKYKNGEIEILYHFNLLTS